MNPNRNAVGWFEIYVQEMDRAQVFYEGTFGVTLGDLKAPGLKMLAFPMQPNLAGCSGALVKMEGKDSGMGGTIVYFSCEDCAEEASRAVAHGGRILKDEMSIGQYGFIALVFDTEGTLIGLHSMK